MPPPAEGKVPHGVPARANVGSGAAVEDVPGVVLVALADDPLSAVGESPLRRR